MEQRHHSDIIKIVKIKNLHKIISIEYCGDLCYKNYIFYLLREADIKNRSASICYNKKMLIFQNTLENKQTWCAHLEEYIDIALIDYMCYIRFHIKPELICSLRQAIF